MIVREAAVDNTFAKLPSRPRRLLQLYISFRAVAPRFGCIGALIWPFAMIVQDQFLIPSHYSVQRQVNKKRKRLYGSVCKA